MNLRFIEAFVWVARLRSFTAAAEKLYTTQAAISARIATLEEDFGVKLFERDNRTVTLTHSGEELLKYAEQLRGISARMLEAVSDRATYGGFIAVGVIEAVVHTWLPELLGRLRQQFPKVRVEIHSYITADLHDELLKGNIDLALTAEALADPAIENSSICGFQMGWIIAPAATGNLVRTGYGLATLPRAAIASELDSAELIALAGVPELAPLPVIASSRRQSESPLAGAVVRLAVEAAQVFSRGHPAGLVVIDGDHI